MKYVFLLAFILAPQIAFTAALPTTVSARPSVAIDGVVGTTAQRRGFAANDPRISQTTNAISAAVTTMANPGCYAAGWISVTACLAVGFGIAVAVPYVADKITNLFFGADGKLSISKPDVPLSSQPAPSSYAALIDQLGSNGQIGYPYTVSGQPYIQHYKTVLGASGYSPISGWNEVYIQRESDTSTSYIHLYERNYLASDAARTPAAEPAQSVAEIPDEDVFKHISPDLLAAAANLAWQSAAQQPNYQGLPYDAANPVTVQDASDWLSANPDKVPSGNDFLAPLPGQSQQGTGSVSQTINVTVDLGPDPGIDEPALEQAPSGQSIIQPLLDQLNPFRSFNLPPHNSQCPVAVIDFNLYGHPFAGRIDSHCALWEQHSGLLTAVMTAFWLLTAAFIFLRA